MKLICNPRYLAYIIYNELSVLCSVSVLCVCTKEPVVFMQINKYTIHCIRIM